MYRHVEESQTLLINTQSKDLEARNKKIVKFGFGQSPFLPPQSVLQALQKSVHHKEYTSVQGDLELRKKMARFHDAHNGLKVSAKNILIAPGSKILILNILLAIKEADVFIASPSWVSYAPQVRLAGHNLIKVKTSFEDRWRILPENLKEATKNKRHALSILIINYPGNPDGLTYAESEIKALAKQARALNFLVVSDEIYALLDHNFKHKSFANYYPEKTITTTGLSKWCGAGGWRFGAALLYENIEPDFKQALIGIGSETYSCAPVPVQMAAKEAYDSYSKLVPYLTHQINILRKIGRYCAEQLIASNIRLHSPEGGFYLFPDFCLYKEKLSAKGIKTSIELCNQLINDTGVALLPASAFGFDQEFLAARLAYVDFQEFEIDASTDIVANCPNVVEGLEKIKKWIQKL